MGDIQGIDGQQYPLQGTWLRRRVRVCFGYDTSATVGGVVVRDDRGPPNRTIIALDDGRFLLSTECQFQLERPGGPARG